MGNNNFKLIYKKYSKKKVVIKSLLGAILFGLVITIFAGFLMGYRVYSVMGHSSEPDIHYGSIVIDYKVPFEELKVGDYITWSRSGKSFVTHKIIAINEQEKKVTTSQTDYFLKPGDNPVTPDAPVGQKEIQGKVIATIPEVGNILMTFKNLIINNGRLNLLGVMGIVLTIASIYFFSKFLYVKTFYLKER